MRVEYPGHERAAWFSTGPHRRYPIEDREVVVPDEKADYVKEALEQVYDISYDQDEGDICGTEMSDGTTCERPADECAYHGSD